MPDGEKQRDIENCSGSFVEISISSASRLWRPLIGQCNPYVILFWNDSELARSKVIKNSSNPDWGGSFQCNISAFDDMFLDEILHIELYSCVSYPDINLSEDFFLGQIELTGKEVVSVASNQSHSLSLKLMPLDASKKKSNKQRISEDSTLQLNCLQKNFIDEDMGANNFGDEIRFDDVTDGVDINDACDKIDTVEDVNASNDEKLKHFLYREWYKECLVKSEAPIMVVDILHCTNIAASKPLLGRYNTLFYSI